MIEEALRFLWNAGRDAAPAVVKAGGEPDHVYYLRQTDGSLVRVEAAAKPAGHKAHSLDSLLALAEQHKGTATVWYSPARVQVVFGADRRSSATLAVGFGEQYRTLAHWREHRPNISQAELVRYLRTTFRDTLPSASLIEVFKKVRFSSTAAINAEVGHGKASLGKELAGEVTGVGQIPEYVVFTIPVFANAEFRNIRTGVECAIEPDAATGNFKVIPLPHELEAAAEFGAQAIRQLINDRLVASEAGTDIPVLHGEE